MITTVYKSEIVPSNDPDVNLIDLYYLEDNTNNYILISEQKLKRTQKHTKKGRKVCFRFGESVLDCA